MLIRNSFRRLFGGWSCFSVIFHFAGHSSMHFGLFERYQNKIYRFFCSLIFDQKLHSIRNAVLRKKNCLMSKINSNMMIDEASQPTSQIHGVRPLLHNQIIIQLNFLRNFSSQFGFCSIWFYINK